MKHNFASSMELPLQLEFRMPAEWEPHSATFLAWPYDLVVWRQEKSGEIPVQTVFVNLVKAISNFEEVYIACVSEQIEQARIALNGIGNIQIFELSYNDIWLRDTGPSFLLHRTSKVLGAVDWKFNCWGDLNIAVPMLQLQLDFQVASSLAVKASALSIFHADIVLEGGSIHVDGEGTVLATKECLLHHNRNPSLSQSEIEVAVLSYVGAVKMIWLPRGFHGDTVTNGHVDNLCCFVKPGHVLLAWTDDVSDPQYDISVEALRELENSVDAQGRTIQVTKLPIPPPNYCCEADCFSANAVFQTMPWNGVGERLPASYINFYLFNGGVVVPGYGHLESDALAVSILEEVFPGRVVVQVQCRDILLGGGSIHCITQQLPSYQN
jgi:agmatine deiminase